MTECINSTGFIFKSAKVLIKKDKKTKFNKHMCQECSYQKHHSKKNCNNCYDTNNYKVCVFKLTSNNFVSSCLSIISDNENHWENFKKNIIDQINGNFVISVTKKDILHSFYANLCKIKVCNSCDIVLLYFKYNIIPGLNCYQQFYCQNNTNNFGINSPSCYNFLANITYDLKSYEYTNIKFYCSENYTFTPQICIT
jgi:hypothetical protein